MKTAYLAHYTPDGDLPVVHEYGMSKHEARYRGQRAALDAGVDPDLVATEMVELHESRWDIPEDRWVLFGAQYVPDGYDLAARPTD